MTWKLPSFFHYHLIFRRFATTNRMVLLVVLNTLNSLAEGLGVLMVLPLLVLVGDSAAEKPKRVKIIFSLFEAAGMPLTIGTILVGMFVFFSLKGFFQYLGENYRNKEMQRFVRRYIRALLEKYRTMDYRFYVTSDTGILTSNITSHSFRMGTAYGSFVNTVSYFFSTFVFLVLSLFIDWVFTLCALGAGLLVLGLTRFLSVRVKAISAPYSESFSNLYKLLIQNIQFFKYLASTDRLRRMEDQVNQAAARSLDLYDEMSRIRALSNAITDPVIIGILSLILYYQLAVLKQPIAGIAVAIILLQRTLKQVLGFQQVWQTFLGSSGTVDSLVKFEQDLSAAQEPQGSKNFSKLTHEIRLESVSFAYQDRQVLHDVSLKIPANSIVAFVGESGSGKSTLVDILTGLLKPTDGRLCADDLDFASIEMGSYRSKIGYVTQETVIFNDTVAANISLWEADPNNSTDLERLKSAVRAANCESFISDLPEGYDTILGDRGVRLSGGQRQRLAIARELYKRPEVLILDEATSALDTDSERAIQISIDALKGKMTVVLIAHRLSTIRNADKIYVLASGRVIESGTFPELTQKTDSRFRAMCELQSLV